MVKKSLFIFLVLSHTMVTSLKADTLPLLIFDDFNSGTINSSLWNVNDPSGVLTQSGGFLKSDSPPNSAYASINSKKTFSGDFEFVLPYKNFSSTAFLVIKGNNAFPAINLTAKIESSQQVSVGISRCQDYQGASSGVFISWKSSSSGNEFTSSSTTSGYLKIQRNGSTINTFYKEASDWISLGNHSDMPTDDVTIEINLTTGANGIFNVDIDAVYYMDSEISALYYDSDGDGYGDPSKSINVTSQASGYVTNGTDCDDSDKNIHPEALDTCGDGIDQNCDGFDKVCYTFPIAMTTDTVYTDKEVNFKSEYKVLATIDFTEVYSGYDPETMRSTFTFQTYGDLNNDGIEDIVLSPFSTSQNNNDDLELVGLTVFLFSENQAYVKNGDFLETLIYRVKPREGVIADFNSDGKNDYFATGQGFDEIPFPGEQNILLLSTDEKTLKDASYSNLPLIECMSHGAGAGDIDNDGDLDIFLVNNNKFDSYFLINDGTGQFTIDDSSSRVSQNLVQLQFGDITTGTNAFYTTGKFFDVNGDNFQDLLLSTMSQNNPQNFTDFYHSRIVYNDGNGGFFSSNTVEFPPGGFNEQTNTTNINPIDLNNDGSIDFILSQSEADPESAWGGQYHQVLINDGLGNFTDDTANRIPYQNFDSVKLMTFPNRTFLADINSDGYLDMVINSISSLLDTFSIMPTSIYLNNEEGIFLPLPGEKIYSGYNPGQLGSSLAPIDFDNDGDIDLIGLNTKNYDDPSLYYGTKGVDVVLFENETFTKSNPATWYYDADNDGYGDPNISMVASVKPSNYVISNKDCNDYDASVHPGTVDIAGDGIDQNCNGSDGKPALNFITIESDLSFELLDTIYKSLSGDINLWTDYKFYGDQGGKLLWELEDYGATVSMGNPVTIESDFSFSIPNATYQPAVGNKINLEMDFKYFGDQGGKMLWELDNYTVK
jgi:hypothetical protein